MFLPTEDAATAVFGLLAPLAASSPPAVKTLSRDLIPVTQIAAAQCPAIFQVQPGFSPDAATRQLGGASARVITFEWFVYVWGGKGSSTTLNNLVDAAMNQIPTDESNVAIPLLINGVACPIWWDPDVAMLPNVPGISDVMIARIEIKLKVPPVVLTP